MSQARINRAKERQLSIKADTEEIRVEIETEKYSQAKIQLAIEKINTTTAYINQDTALIKQYQSQTQRALEGVKLVTMREGLTFAEKQLQQLKQENALKIESKDINIRALKETNTHQHRLLGSGK